MLDSSANRCFVCGPGNDRGLGVRFRLDDDVCRAEFTPTESYAGYDGVVHGGILFCLLDDVMANWLYLQGKRCFTARAEVRYRQPLPVGTPVRMEGRLLRRKGRVAVIEGKVFRQDNDDVVVEATGSFMLDG
ncbi:MAG: PaaI family thioesterase [Pseudomonadota bacterium]|nr:PaaI family thioesterase [Pseudomonadota bacterium]